MTERRYAWAEQVAVFASAQRAAVVDVRRPQRPPVVMEDSAAVIWGLLEQPASVTDVASELQEVFAITAAEAAGAVQLFVQDLVDVELLREVDAAESAS